MIRSLTTLMMFLVLSASSIVNADVVPDVAKSVHKIVILNGRGEPMYLGSSFFMKLDDGSVVGVTNNHLCESIAGRNSYIKLTDGQRNMDYKNPKLASKIEKVSMSFGDDICFFTTSGPAPIGLDAGNDASKLSKVTVVGYPGDHYNVVPVDGYISDSFDEFEPAGIAECEKPPYPSKYDAVSCALLKLKVMFSKTLMFEITPNIGPGFSGSPVIDKSGKVIGVVARYFEPNIEYTNGNGLIIPISKVKDCAKRIVMMPYDDKRVIAFSKIMEFSKSLAEYFKRQQEEDELFVKRLVNGILDEGNGT